MKLVILLLAVVGASYAAPTAQLVQDFRDFIVAIPIDKIRKISADHLENDPEYKAALKYLQSKEYKTMAKNVHMKASVKEARLIIKEAGLDTELFERVMEAFIESLNIVIAENQKRSFAKIIEDIDAVIPYDKLMDLLSNKLENSAAFRKFFDTISGERMETLADKILRSEEFRILAKELVSMDIPVYKIIDIVYSVLGWKNVSGSPNGLD